MRLLTAIVLMVLLICAAEVGMRIWVVKEIFKAGEIAGKRPELVAPSPCCWIDVVPLLDLPLAPKPLGTATDLPVPGTRIRTSEFGTRGNSPIIPRPAETFRVLLLGGDMVFGSGLDEQEALASRLFARIGSAPAKTLEILNAGCPGAGPLVNLLRFRNHLSALQPQLVIYALTGDDLLGDIPIRGSLRLDSGKLPAYAPHPKYTATGDPRVDGICDQFVTVQWLMGRLQESSAFSAVVSERAGVLGNPEQVNRLLAPIVVLARLVESQGGRLAVFIAPTAWDMRSGEGLSPTAGRSRVPLDGALRSLDPQGTILIQETIGRFQSVADKGPLFLKETGNLSAAGIDAYALLLAEFLTASHWIPISAASSAAPGGAVQSGVPPPATNFK